MRLRIPPLPLPTKTPNLFGALQPPALDLLHDFEPRIPRIRNPRRAVLARMAGPPTGP